MAFQDFIVLGIIPGTNIQINFQLWLTVTIGLIALWQFRRALHSKVLVVLMLRRALHKAPLANLSVYDITI